MDITRNAKLKLLLVLFSMGFILSACNSGSTDASPPVKEDFDGLSDTSGQIATVTLTAGSGVNLNDPGIYNLSAQLQSLNFSKIWNGEYLEGKNYASASEETSSNSSWNFMLYGDPFTLEATWDSSCKSGEWYNNTLATANLVCYNSKDTNIKDNTAPQIIDRCKIYTGGAPSNINDIDKYDTTMNTPMFSTPKVDFYINPKNGVYHISCKYSWRGN